MATATSAGASTALNPGPMALLPPLPLYRRILRSHRKHLPHKMRVLGDMYIKKEFRDHRDVENPMHIVGHWQPASLTKWLTIPQIGFLSEWQMYAQKIEGDMWQGDKLDKGKIDKMNGMIWAVHLSAYTLLTQPTRPTNRTAVRIDAGHPERRN